MKTILRLFLINILLSPAISGIALSETITINAVGDVMLAGKWAPAIKKQGYDSPFKLVTAELAKADITIANLESPIARGGAEFTDKKFRFRADPALALALKRAGINLVTLANNHSMDFGAEALAETLQHLETSGINWIGAGETIEKARRSALYTIKGKTIAFLGYSLTQPTEFYASATRPGTAPGFETIFVADIRQARQQADYVIVSFHWGTEGKKEIQGYQQVVAHTAIDAGADVIIGHHPHVLRGIEKYKRGIIFYSLGNFIFASKSKTADSSAIISLKFGDTINEAEIIPLDILPSRVGFQPRLLSGKQAADVILQLNSLSKPFKTEIQSRDGHYFVTF